MIKRTNISKTTATWWSKNRKHKAIMFVCLFILGGFTVVFVKASTAVDNNFIISVSEVGKISQPANYSGRDGGASALVGGKVTWVFGDTLYTPNVSFTGDLFRSATAAIGTIDNPTQVSEPLDSRNVPNQLIPYTPAELAYNVAKRNGGDRYAIWPSTIIARSDGKTAWVFYNDLLISAGQWVTQGTGVALLGADSTLATRQSGFLFSSSETPFRKANVVGETAYVYSGEAGQKFCKVSRVNRDQAGTRSAYQFWDGTTWQGNINLSKPVIPCSNMGYAVMYNRALKSYVQALIPNYSKAVYFSYAPAAEGPWTTPVKGFDLPMDTTTGSPYAPNFHPELSTDSDRTVYLSYSGSATTVRLMKITLQIPANGESASSLAAAAFGVSQAVPQPKARQKQSKQSTVPTNPETNASATPKPEQTSETKVTDQTVQTQANSKTVKSENKQGWLQRLKLYVRRHWTALLFKLSN